MKKVGVLSLIICLFVMGNASALASAVAYAESGVLRFHMNNQSAYGEHDLFVHDFSRAGNNAYIATNEARWNRSEGVIRDGAFEFDGYNDRITIPDSTSLSVNPNTGFTFALWVNFRRTKFIGEGSQNNYLHFAGKSDDNNHEYIFRQYNSSNAEGRNNRISFYVFNLQGGLGTGSYVQEPIVTGEWVHLVGVVNKTHTQLWKNGVLKDADRLSEYDIVPGNGNAPLRLGTSDGDSYFRGAMDEVRIYNRALSPNDIRALYHLRNFSE